MQIHNIKLKAQYCTAVLNGLKTFEIRYDDRGYKPQDIIHFIPVDEEGNEVEHDIKNAEFVITYLLVNTGKHDNYIQTTRNQRNDDGEWVTFPVFEYNKNSFPFGHGEKSVYLISRFMQLSDVEAIAIRWHMGAYDNAARGGSAMLSQALKKYPLAQFLHEADNEASMYDDDLDGAENV